MDNQSRSNDGQHSGSNQERLIALRDKLVSLRDSLKGKKDKKILQSYGVSEIIELELSDKDGNIKETRKIIDGKEVKENDNV